MIGRALDCFVNNESKITKFIWAGVSVVVVFLNLLFFSAGAQYRNFPLSSIWDKAGREAYLQFALPIRLAVELVNQINLRSSPVAIFGQPLTAGIKSDSVYSNWYNFNFQSEINAANMVDDVANILLRRGIDFVILDELWKGGVEKRELILKATDLIAEYGSVSVRKVKNDFRFRTELLRNPDFSSLDGWSLTPETQYDAGLNVISAKVTTPAIQSVAVLSGQRYLNTVVARCFKEVTSGRVQINWLDVNGQFITTDIKTFYCMSDWTEHKMEITAPLSAAVAIVYTSGHTATAIQFQKNSLKQ